MTSVLISAHVLLCSFAIGFGWLTVLGLLKRHVSVSEMIWFLRFTLGSSIAALFLGLHHPVPAQRVAMVTVYGVGLVILCWRGFHLEGAWRSTFAFAIPVILYLNVLALSIQVFGVGAKTWFYSQATLLTAAAGIGMVGAMRTPRETASLVVAKHSSLGTPVVRH